MLGLLFRRQQISEIETVARNDFARDNAHGKAKVRSVVDKRMELSVFAAGIGARRQIAKERFVEQAPREGGIKSLGVHANGDRAEPSAKELAREFARVALPDGEDRLHVHSREVALAVGAQVLQEDVAEGDALHTLF